MTKALERGTGLVSGIFIALFCAFFSYSHAEAAMLYLDPADATVARGDTVTLSVRIDTNEGECINAADVVIDYDPSVRAVDVSRGDSIFSLWVEDPTIDEKNHQITFAGGIPGGYCGRIPGDPRLTNILAELVFRLPGLSVGTGDKNTAKIHIDDVSQVRLHDPYGTKAPLKTQDAILTLLSTPGTSVTDTWNDTVASDNVKPADFSITLAKDKAAFSGKYFITFNSQDKQSGIDHYEVMEEPFKDFNLFRWGRADAPWVTAQSPYVLKDQSLNSTIRVKAVDKAGNETISVLVPDEAMRRMSAGSIASIVLVTLVVLAALGASGYLLWKRKQRIINTYTEEHVD